MSDEERMPTYLPYARQWISEEDIKEVEKVLRSDWITQGSRVSEFEQALAEFVGAKYAVALSSGTAALHAACFAASIKQGDEVITTPITFAATSNSILYLGGKPVFADIKGDTYNIDPQQIEKKLTSATRAIIPVDFAGQPADLEKIYQIAQKHGLVVIEDAAHALGAEYKNCSKCEVPGPGSKINSRRKKEEWIKVGSCRHSDMTVFSFHPVKLITTGEGGVVITNNKNYCEKLFLFRSHGITKNEKKMRNKEEGPWYYEMGLLGYNYRITDFQCALGLGQLRRLGEFLARRREIVKMYNQAFRNIEEVITPYERPQVKSAWHLYVIRLKLSQLTATRRQIFEFLRKHNIGVHVHYIPVYYHPYYQELGYKKGFCSKAEQYYEEAITLPLFPKMKNKDVSKVINAVKKIITRCKMGSGLNI